MVKTRVRFLLLHNTLPQTRWLKITHIQYLPVSVGPDSRHKVTGFSAQGLTKLKSRRRPACLLIWSAGSFIQVVGRSQFLAVREIRSLFLALSS